TESSDAFGVFYARHERAVGAYFVRRTRDGELAADLTSETFATALIRHRKRRPEAPPVAWLFTIAHHIWLRSLERRQVEDRARRRLGLRLEVTDDIRDRFEQLIGDEQAEVLLDGLPTEQ